MKLYITFGQIHKHYINDIKFDKDWVAVIECNDYAHGRELASEYFNNKFAFSYDTLDSVCLEYYPRGLIYI